MSDKLAFVKRHGCKPRLALFAFLQVAFIENGDKLAVVKRHDCKPRLALFALLKMFAPRDPPWWLFYRRGLKEFLVACGVHEPSWSADAHASVLHEGASEGRRRVIFDLENISEHEKAAGAKSEGLTIGPCCDSGWMHFAHVI